MLTLGFPEFVSLVLQVADSLDLANQFCLKSSSTHNIVALISFQRAIYSNNGLSYFHQKNHLFPPVEPLTLTATGSSSFFLFSSPSFNASILFLHNMCN